MTTRQIILGTRIPRDYFITSGTGESDFGVHVGSFDDALKEAGIANCNIITYSSVMPPEAREVPKPERLSHGAVLETILAHMSGLKDEILTAGLLIWMIREKASGEVIGGYVAEYFGHLAEKEAEAHLMAAMKGMNERRGHTDELFETFDVRAIIKSLIPQKKYGTVLVAIGFTSYIFPVIDS